MIRKSCRPMCAAAPCLHFPTAGEDNLLVSCSSPISFFSFLLYSTVSPRREQPALSQLRIKEMDQQMSPKTRGCML